MSGIMHDYMETYIRSLINEDDNILLEIEKYGIENKVPIVQKETANFLKFMVHVKKPKRILELGTAIGYSAILMERASTENIYITTVERDDNMVIKATENIEKYGYEDYIKIEKGECEEILDKLCKENTEPYDIIFMDAGKGHYSHFLPYCLKLLDKEGIIIADNVLFRGMVASKELIVRRKITIVKRMKKYLEEVSNGEFITSILPMGDGIAITIRRN
ncbi:O-methyltransferase [Hathewaya histolytica]|uniref:tRNA 5-hydroxyuridine methyltransferase n=1 Tax=Hathewaya histolytica TaxID=1498 RepID=A0A4U9RF00_HATHI|nr:O-methyltransferase [Hathewaya histolytica]VTQ90384.1 methyltransferase [Hathewaya histolytica]